MSGQEVGAALLLLERSRGAALIRRDGAALDALLPDDIMRKPFPRCARGPGLKLAFS